MEEDGGGGAGELGVLEEGELPCEEAPETKTREEVLII